MSDLIKREDAINSIYKLKKTVIKHDILSYRDGLSDALEIVQAIPSADRPQGEWKHLKGDEWLCSNCGYVVWTEGSWEHPLERGKDYCEHCGAHMKGADDE